jgi:3-dehydroquinate dehydratase-1
MSRHSFDFSNTTPLVVGSIGDQEALANSTPESLKKECDIAEIRLDLFYQSVLNLGRDFWQHLLPFPLLFTARCKAEGSPFDLDLSTRIKLLRIAMPDASLLDIEVMTLQGVSDFILEVQEEKIPWLASYHDFEKLPSEQTLDTRLLAAKNAGAHIFKVAAHLDSVDSLAELANFQTKQDTLPISSMGMGILAPVSRLLCAQAGSVLNYGFIGKSPTAPGQWSAKQLKEAIQSLLPLPC